MASKIYKAWLLPFFVGMLFPIVFIVVIALVELSVPQETYWDYIQEASEDDVKSLVRFKDSAEIDRRRIELVNYIWKQEILPDDRPTNMTDDVHHDIWSNLTHTARVSRIEAVMEYDIKSTGYVLYPASPSSTLVILHAGHSKASHPYPLKAVVEKLLEAGFTVAHFDMPLHGDNTVPLEIKDPAFGAVQLYTHDHMALLDREDFSAVKLFLHPILAFINAVENDYGDIVMIGHSGGGWTTTLYAAVDPRINKSFQVAGTLPFFVRSATSPFRYDRNDYEDLDGRLYSIANYLELYVMGAVGKDRAQLQVLYDLDTCCYPGGAATLYSDIVSEITGSFGGQWDLYLDKEHEGHGISNKVMEIILEHIRMGASKE